MCRLLQNGQPASFAKYETHIVQSLLYLRKELTSAGVRSSSSAMLRRLEESSELKYSQRSPSITLYNINKEETNVLLSVLKQTSL